MLRNFFKVTIRNLWRSKGFSTINIAGLTIGMAAAMLIMLWVRSEVTFDSFHKNSERIYQMYSRDSFNGKTDVWGNTPALMTPELKQSYAEVDDAVRYRIVFFLTTVGENHFNLRGAFADPGFLTMFSFPMKQGQPENALKDDFSIVITETLAKQLFGNEDPLGKTILVENADNFTVTGVLKDLPHQTEFDFEYLLPWNYVTKLGWDANQSWSITNAGTYVMLKDGASQAAFDAKVKDIVIQHTKGAGGSSTQEVFSHPLSKIHLYTRSENGQLTGGRIDTVRMFAAIAVFILLIACINFMNLSTARSEKRSKEVGIRKVVGANHGSLIIQFMGESTLIALLAFAVALAVVQLSLPAFDQIVAAPLALDFTDPGFWGLALAFIFFTGLVAGSYPAFYLSSSQPVKVLKGSLRSFNTLVTPRKVLVVLQFTFAITLIICTIVVKRQIQFAQDRDAGYNRSNLGYNFTQGDVLEHFDLIKNELIGSGAVTAVSRTFSPITRIWGTLSGLTWQGSSEADKKINFLEYGGDADLSKTIGIRITQGRDLDINLFPSDTAAVLLNEAALETMHFRNPIGEIVKDDQGEPWHVVGVIKDFIVESPYDEIQPMVIKGWRTRYGAIHFRLNPENPVTANLAKIEKVFRQYNPQYPFECYFADEFYARKFGDEKQTGTLSALFSALTIFISCLGLFGLATYMAETRTKEIGVRKVLGASTASITTLLSGDFLKLVLISIILSSPIALYAMNQWLGGFHYKQPMNIWIFILSGALALLIAFFTVSYQSIKAAMANPVKSLRTE